MELRVLEENRQKIDEDSIFSIKVGGVRRQAEVRKERPFIFDGRHVADEIQVKIDLLRKVGTTSLLLQQGLDQYKADFQGGASCEFKVKKPTSVAKVHSDDESQKEKERETTAMAKDAKEYLENHKVLEFIQVVLETVIKEKPTNPFVFMAKHFMGGYTPRSDAIAPSLKSKDDVCHGSTGSPQEQKTGGDGGGEKLTTPPTANAVSQSLNPEGKEEAAGKEAPKPVKEAVGGKEEFDASKVPDHARAALGLKMQSLREKNQVNSSSETPAAAEVNTMSAAPKAMEQRKEYTEGASKTEIERIKTVEESKQVAELKQYMALQLFKAAGEPAGIEDVATSEKGTTKAREEQRELKQHMAEQLLRASVASEVERTANSTTEATSPIANADVQPVQGQVQELESTGGKLLRAAAVAPPPVANPVLESDGEKVLRASEMVKDAGTQVVQDVDKFKTELLKALASAR